MKKLIICEKPSLAKNVRDAIAHRENVQRVGNKDLYYYESSSYVITFCFGHLLTLVEPEKYIMVIPLTHHKLNHCTKAAKSLKYALFPSLRRLNL